MRDDDNDFFVMVAGVLAAIVLVVSWWFVTGGVAPADPASAHGSAADDTGDDAGDDTVGVLANDAASETLEDTATADTSDGANSTEAEDAPEATDAAEDSAPPEIAPSSPPPTEVAPAGPTPEPAASALAALADDGRLGVFAQLLSGTGLDDLLSGPGGYTVFAPTDDAFSDAAGDPTVLALLEAAPDDALRHHIVEGVFSVDDLAALADGDEPGALTALGGETISVERDGDSILLGGTASLATTGPTGPTGSAGHDESATEGTSRTAQNGVVHVVYGVLVPPLGTLNVLVDLEPILFASGSAEIAPESIATLDRLVTVLASTTTDVTIEGHTDNTGDLLQNQVLSEDRARAVLNYLVAHGIDEQRLRSQGFGPSRPIADNSTEAGRAQNRRIDFSAG